MKKEYLFLKIYFIVVICVITVKTHAFALEPTEGSIPSYQSDIKIAERLTRIEEGQKSIVNEMRTRFKAVDERFESILREMNERFESVLREVRKGFEAVDKRFEAVDKRFEAVDKRIDQQNTYFLAILATMFVAVIGFAIWDRKNGFCQSTGKKQRSA